jgi:hypothetical protein
MARIRRAVANGSLSCSTIPLSLSSPHNGPTLLGGLTRGVSECALTAAPWLRADPRQHPKVAGARLAEMRAFHPQAVSAARGVGREPRASGGGHRRGAVAMLTQLSHALTLHRPAEPEVALVAVAPEGGDEREEALLMGMPSELGMAQMARVGLLLERLAHLYQHRGQRSSVRRGD